MARWMWVLAIGGAAGCDGLLDVEIPGRVVEEDLESPGLSQTFVNSVIADVECAWDNYVAAASHHSDEWVATTGNGNMLAWGLRNVGSAGSYASGECESRYGPFAALHKARFQAGENFERIRAFPDPDVPDKALYLATIQAYAGWPLIAFGEGFCGTPIGGDGPVFEPSELLAMAETVFTDAVVRTEAAGLSELAMLARIGRARARLGLGMYEEAISDAALVPAGFVHLVSRDPVPDDRANTHVASVNGTAADGAGQKHATIAPDLRVLDWKGVSDPRIGAFFDGTMGQDGVTPHWRHDKAVSLGSPTVLASWREAQLILAEAYAMTDRLPESIQVLDSFHAAAGLPPVTATDLPTRDDVIRHLLEERRRELFAEGGHRLRDHLRWRGTDFQVPFLGEPGSIHPDGIWLDPDTGVPGSLDYGSATCFPVPAVEGTGS